MFDALDHVIVAVRDLEAATSAYARLLGRSPSWHGEHPGAGTANTLFRLENTYLELMAPHGEGTVGRAVSGWLDARGEGLLGLAFATSDAEACHRELAKRGLEPGALENGMGRDVGSGAFREWIRVPLPLSRSRGVLLFGIQHTTSSDVLPRAAALESEASAVFGLDHTVVQTADGEATKALYGDGLGLRLALDREFEQWGVRLLFFRVGGITVEIAARLSAEGQGESTGLPELEGDEDRLWGLSYRVADAEAARARVAAAGFEVSEVRSGRKPGTRVLSVKAGTFGVPTLMLQPPEE